MRLGLIAALELELDREGGKARGSVGMFGMAVAASRRAVPWRLWDTR